MILFSLLAGCGLLGPKSQDILTDTSWELDCTGSWETDLTQAEREMVDAVNAVRAQGGDCGDESFGPSDPLASSDPLRCAARLHSQDMAVRDFFDHQNPDGDGVAERVSDQGYPWSAVGENVSIGGGVLGGVEATMAAWMDSPAHCSNILNPLFTELGVGAWREGDTVWWTQVFADK